MTEPSNKKLYAEVKKKADKIFERHSLYKSMYIQKEYQNQGGKYKIDKPETIEKAESGTKRWLKEEWIKVSDYLNNKKVPCGQGSFDACRPSKRVNKQTPITIQELQKKYGNDYIKKKVNEKLKNPDNYIQWDSLEKKK